MHAHLKNLIRPHYLALEGYSSAAMEGGKAQSKIFMNANENPFMLPDLQTGWNRYPEPQPAALAQAYSKAYGVTPDRILMTRGADEAIALLCRAFCEPGADSIAIHPPTFGIYEVYGKSLPVNIIEVPLIKDGRDFRLDKKGLIAAAHKARLVFICNPNNPTGTAFVHEDIREICHAVEGKAIVVVDEAYAEMSQLGTMVEHLKSTPNLIILRTLSKSYGLAGMRMGAALCHDTDFIAFMRSKVMETYPLPKGSIEAALIALAPKNRKKIQENICKMLAERDRMRAAFEASPLVKNIFPSQANFLLIEMERAGEFAVFCAENNVFLRDFSGKRYTENCLRISPGLPEDNDKLFCLLKNFEIA